MRVKHYFFLKEVKIHKNLPSAAYIHTIADILLYFKVLFMAKSLALLGERLYLYYIVIKKITLTMHLLSLLSLMSIQNLEFSILIFLLFISFFLLIQQINMSHKGLRFLSLVSSFVLFKPILNTTLHTKLII